MCKVIIKTNGTYQKKKVKKKKGSVECGTACFSGWCWLGCGWWKRRALEFPVVFSLFLDGTTLYEHNGSCVPLPGIPSGSQLSQNIISPARVCLVKTILVVAAKDLALCQSSYIIIPYEILLWISSESHLFELSKKLQACLRWAMTWVWSFFSTEILKRLLLLELLLH